jgi:hypothetical protein
MSWPNRMMPNPFSSAAWKQAAEAVRRKITPWPDFRKAAGRDGSDTGNPRIKTEQNTRVVLRFGNKKQKKLIYSALYRHRALYRSRLFNTIPKSGCGAGA